MDVSNYHIYIESHVYQVWVVDQYDSWHYIAPNFVSYFRVMLAHVGIKGWEVCRNFIMLYKAVRLLMTYSNCVANVYEELQCRCRPPNDRKLSWTVVNKSRICISIMFGIIEMAAFVCTTATST